MLNNPEVEGQLGFGPLYPKPGSVKAEVLRLLQTHREGICRKDAALWAEVYELSSRIGELESDGWVISRGRCNKHAHRQKFTLYFLP